MKFDYAWLRHSAHVHCLAHVPSGKDYPLNARRMQRYVAAECSDVLPIVDLAQLPELSPQEEALLDSAGGKRTDHSTDEARGDPADRLPESQKRERWQKHKQRRHH